MQKSEARPCVFCAIVRAETTAHIVFETEAALAFLDTTPLFLGHVLVVPREHVATLPELSPAAVGPLFEHVRRVAAAIPTALGAEGTFVAMNNAVSQSVPHLHVHVVPRTKGDGLRGFFWPRRKYASASEAEAIAARIHDAMLR